MLKILKKLVLWFIYLVLFLVGVLIASIWDSIYQDTASRKFERELLQRFSQKNTLLAADIPLQNRWHKVCVVPDYSNTLDVLDKAGHLDVEQLDFIIGKPLDRIQENRWQLVFVTAENKAYAFYMLKLREGVDLLCGKYEQTLFKIEKKNRLSLVLKTD